MVSHECLSGALLGRCSVDFFFFGTFPWYSSSLFSAASRIGPEHTPAVALRFDRSEPLAGGQTEHSICSSLFCFLIFYLHFSFLEHYPHRMTGPRIGNKSQVSPFTSHQCYYCWSFNQLLLAEMRLGVPCVSHSPVFILSFVVDIWDLAVALFLNGSISIFMLFGARDCLVREYCS